jgi:hypothetical protein
MIRSSKFWNILILGSPQQSQDKDLDTGKLFGRRRQRSPVGQEQKWEAGERKQ